MEQVLAVLKKLLPERLLDAVRPAYHQTLAVLAAVVYRFPGRKLVMVGVTGTNGKSTTGNLLAAILEANGRRVGLVTTVNFQIADRKWLNEKKMTSFGRFQTQRLLRQMVRAGCTHAVLEVSSHALSWQQRVWGIPFDVAVFTNLTRDHLDLHGTMRAYRDTKGKLFAGLTTAKRKPGVRKVSVVNLDDKEAPYFSSFPADIHYGFSRRRRPARATSDVVATAHKVVAATKETTFELRVAGESAPVRLHLPGDFNVSNALAAAAAGHALGAELPEIVEGIDVVPGVPGRMEQVEAGQRFAIVVDYAHSPDAFKNVLATLRPLTAGQLISVFGATGDRDRGKRPELGKIAAKYSDLLFLTEEDPGSEDPAEIIKEIIPGVEAAGKHRGDYWVVVDRREAIRKALSVAGPKDAVVLLAKGHEMVMTGKDGKYPWDDRVVAREEWQSLAQG